MTVRGFSVVSEAEVDVFLEFSCSFCDPTDVGNVISGSHAFSKSSLYIWKFLVHVLFIIQYAAEGEWRNGSRKNVEAEPKWKGHSAVDVSGGESKVPCCKEECCIRTADTYKL